MRVSLLDESESHEAFEFVGEDLGWRSGLGLPPEIKVLESFSHQASLFDDRDNLQPGATLSWAETRFPDPDEAGLRSCLRVA